MTTEETFVVPLNTSLFVFQACKPSNEGLHAASSQVATKEQQFQFQRPRKKVATVQCLISLHREEKKGVED